MISRKINWSRWVAGMLVVLALFVAADVIRHVSSARQSRSTKPAPPAKSVDFSECFLAVRNCERYKVPGDKSESWSLSYSRSLPYSECVNAISNICREKALKGCR